jgi:hypothetical protein
MSDSQPEPLTVQTPYVRGCVLVLRPLLRILQALSLASMLECSLGSRGLWFSLADAPRASPLQTGICAGPEKLADFFSWASNERMAIS